MNIIKKHLAGYRYSVNGIWLAFSNEPNMIFHFAAAIVVILVNSLLKIDTTEWLVTLILIGLTWMAEIFNTAIERLADRVTKDQDPLIGQVKDLASGAVLIICIVALICALIIYIPYVF
jgi:diacylglycerol kinase